MQSYDYDPTARCPRWVKFINECTNDDPKREDALQTIMGYIMLADCRYQLMFLLMGNGGNGKFTWEELSCEEVEVA
jgi:putative DNA primase/helicase